MMPTMIRMLGGAALVVLLSACNSPDPVSLVDPPDAVSTTNVSLAVPTTPKTKSLPPALVDDGEPIVGYGDFSGIGYYSVDWALATELMAACVIDQGFPVRLEDDGILFGDVPADQNAEASRTLDRCMDGLNLPEFEWPDADQLLEIYAFSLAVRDCLIAEGFEVPEPPGFDAWAESYTTGPWSPYEFVGSGYGPDWVSINTICPQSPVGGWGAWEPGDPITPALAEP